MGLGFERYCAEIVVQSESLRALVERSDMRAPVPSCPGWNVGQLVRHLGGGQAWVDTLVRTRATEPPDDTHFRDLARYADEDPAVLGPWLTDTATGLAESLRAAGQDAPMWTPLPGVRAAAFFARRFAHETVIHRADAVLAAGEEFTVAEDVAVDALDEWLELGSLPEMFTVHPERRELLGPGRTVHLHATDTAPEADAEWVVDLTGDVLGWRRAHEKSAVAVRGPLTELLLLVYRRRPVDTAAVEVFGDAALLDFWLERVGFH